MIGQWRETDQSLGNTNVCISALTSDTQEVYSQNLEHGILDRTELPNGRTHRAERSWDARLHVPDYTTGLWRVAA